MARGTETGMARFALVAQLARELDPKKYDAREVADFARWILRTQALLFKIRDRKFSGMSTDRDVSRLEKLEAQFERVKEREGIAIEADATTAQLVLTLPSGEGNGAERGKWEVR